MTAVAAALPLRVTVVEDPLGENDWSDARSRSLLSMTAMGSVRTFDDIAGR